MGKVTDVKYVTAHSVDELETAVQAAIAQGWLVEDLPVQTNMALTQKMVKRESDENDIVAFNVLALDQTVATVIDAVNHTAVLTVANGSSLTGVTFQMTLSTGASSDIDTPQTFTDGVAKAFTITSESGEDQVWNVTINVAA